MSGPCLGTTALAVAKLRGPAGEMAACLIGREGGIEPGVEVGVEVRTLEDFVHRIASAFLPHGYWFYVLGEVPAGKDVCAVDRKLTARYGTETSRCERTRRKTAGQANIRYLRCGRQFILAATRGAHRFFEDEAGCIRDARRDPIKVGGYSMRARGGHAHVRIELGEYRRLKAHVLELARQGRGEELEATLRKLPWRPYAPVRRQLALLARLVAAGSACCNKEARGTPNS